MIKEHVVEDTELERLERVELFLSQMLRTGVLVSAAVILVGAVLLFATEAQTLLHNGMGSIIAYPPDPNAVRVVHTLPAVWAGLLAGDPDAVIDVGLLLLIATPVFRVAVSIPVFLLQRDRRYTLITTFVLVVLLLSFVIGTVE